MEVGGAAHDVHVAVAVDIERQVAEVVDVAVVVCKGAEFVLHPARGLVPILAGYDVEPAVAVDIGEGAGLVRPEIDLVLPEGDFVGTADGPSDRGQERERREDVTDHAHDCISFDEKEAWSMISRRGSRPTAPDSTSSISKQPLYRRALLGIR